MKYGLGLSVGDGKVVPEVKYMLKPGFERSLDLLLEEYHMVTLSVMERSANLGVASVQLETEFVEPLVLNQGWAKAVAANQKEVLHKYNSEHGINTALRGTVADVRRFSQGLRAGGYFEAMMECFGGVSAGGADLLSIESRGGQEVFSYSLIRNDLPGLLFALGVLAPRDVRFLWREIVKNSGNAIPAGDTACALANSAMVLADGLLGRKISHSISAVIRAMSVVRTLACYEEGARGPGKDCAYENVVVKAVTGYPMSMEGKTSAMAHSSLVGNVAAAACDLWSNETIVFDDAFGGKTTAVILEMLSYDTAIMNQSISSGTGRTLRQLYIDSDRYRDPQALVLCPDSAVRIARAVVSERIDYERVVAAAKEAVNIIEENKESLRLPETELKYLARFKSYLESAPEESRLIDESVGRYRDKVADFRPSNYEI
jgi:methanol--5-hydroxybenzimidazolylcobamide Co-methyltransferase